LNSPLEGGIRSPLTPLKGGIRSPLTPLKGGTIILFVDKFFFGNHLN